MRIVFADASKFTDDSNAFAFELLEKAGVGVAPGVDFGQAGKRAVRFSYASSEENIREAAKRLGEIVIPVGFLRILGEPKRAG